MTQEAFGSVDSQQALHHMLLEQYVPSFSRLKPTFLHHAESIKTLHENAMASNWETKHSAF
jgi:hypothetical protein